jgi:hypothetical protein
MLAEVLRAAGYRTFAFTGGAALDGRHGFSRGFDLYAETLMEATTREERPIDFATALGRPARRPPGELERARLRSLGYVD